jgi:hypothetical protein
MRSKPIRLTGSERKLIEEGRVKDKKQAQYNANAVKLLEIAAKYARHCRKIGYAPSFSDFSNQFDDCKWAMLKKPVYERVLEIIRFSQNDVPDFGMFL